MRDKLSRQGVTAKLAQRENSGKIVTACIYGDYDFCRVWARCLHLLNLRVCLHLDCAHIKNVRE